MQFTPYAIPAMVALLAKVGIFYYARHSKVHNSQTKIYLLFLFAVSIQDLAEIRFFVTNAEGLPPISECGRLWYSAIILALALMLHLATLTGTSWHKPEHIGVRGLVLLYAPTLILQTLLWTTPLLIVDFEPMAYTITQIPGPLYFLFQLYAFAYLFLTAALLAHGCRTLNTTFRRLQSKFLLVGLIPFIVLAITILCLRLIGFRGFNATATLPVTITIFLVVTAYATHQYRLFDIAFFIPWSKVRKRKTAFYKRIQTLIAEIADMRSVKRIVERLSGALHCPVVLIGGPRPALAMAGESLGIARFPLDELKKLDHIVVAHEIADTMPATHALMKRHKVAAIVPFHPHSEAAASWMLLGESFSEQVYTPLDFQMVEALFARLADHFLDKQLLLRSQLSEAQREMQALHDRLANAWEQLEEARKKHRLLQDENHRLQRKNSQLLRHRLTDIEIELMDEAVAGKKTLSQFNAEFEARLIEKVLEHCDGNRHHAAELLGLSPHALHQKILRYKVY